MGKEYNYEDYIHFRCVYTNDGTLVRTDIDYKEIEHFNLDKIEKLAPQSDSVSVSNYLLKYWSPIMGSDAVSTFIYLKLQSSPNADYTCVSVTHLSQIMGKTNNTTKKYLNILEKHGFITVFRRLHLKDNNRETSPYTKLRLTVPMLTEEQVLSLPKFLQEEHKKEYGESV